MEEDREVDLHQLDKTIDVLVLSNQYQKAKEILVDEYESVKKAGDKKSVDAVLGLLVFVCGASDPPCLTEGRDFCIADDVKRLVIPCFAHRMMVNSRTSALRQRTREAEQVLTDILEKTAVPI